MTGILNNKLSGILSSGKYFSRVRCAYYADPFSLYICNSIYPEWGYEVPEGVKVFKVSSNSLNIQARDSLIIRSTKGRWIIKFDDYVHSGILDTVQMYADLQAILTLISRNTTSDFLDDHRFVG